MLFCSFVPCVLPLALAVLAVIRFAICIYFTRSYERFKLNTKCRFKRHYSRLDIYRNLAFPLPLVTVSVRVCANANVMNEHTTESPLFEGTPFNRLTEQFFVGVIVVHV